MPLGAGNDQRLGNLQGKTKMGLIQFNAGKRLAIRCDEVDQAGAVIGPAHQGIENGQEPTPEMRRVFLQNVRPADSDEGSGPVF